MKENSDKNVVFIKEKLYAMKGKIDELQNIVFKKNLCKGASGFDIMMIGKYNTMKDLENYIVHPLHVETDGYIVNLCEELVSFCYEE